MSHSRKSLLTLLDYSADEIGSIITHGKELKSNRLKNESRVIDGKTAVLIFEKPSLRTRVSFEVAIHELGGNSINLQADMIQMGSRESVADVAQNLGRWVHLVIARTYAHETLERLARHSRLPTINALSDAFHPCQALAFALTLHEHLPSLKQYSVAFIGDGNNVCRSLMVLCAKLGYHFSLACPEGYAPPRKLIERCAEIALERGAKLSLTHDPREAVAGASVIYTDVWTSMGQEAEAQRRKTTFNGYQVNDSLLKFAPPETLISHCLPAHRGEEITSDILDSDRSIAFDEAENRLHVQKAVIHHLFT